MGILQPASDEMTITVRSAGARVAPGADDRRYLLLFEEGDSSLHEMPAEGELTIGRSPQADVRVADVSASRAHAKLVVTRDEVTVHDLGSRNGTSVNGVTIATPRALMSGDIVGVCNATLVFHRDARPVRARNVVDARAFQQRLDEELDRALRYCRPVTLAVAHLDPARIADRARVGLALAGQLRSFDLASWAGASELALLLPELTGDGVAEVLDAVVARLAQVDPSVRVGWATCPSDGCDPDALFAGARASAASSAPSARRGAASLAETLDVGGTPILVCDPSMARIYELLRRLAASDLAVLVTGPTGAGKEIAARALHAWSKRKDAPLVTLNSAAVPDNLVESELFGHERGAFSGALTAKTGLFEAAHGGTLFLDEVGELALATQAKLLRVLETKRLTRVGDTKERAVDVRIVAATNRNLDAEVSAGRFREDLLYRLRAARVVLPPLRDRPRELPILAATLLASACATAARAPLALAPATLQNILHYAWPGNVRELKNAMEYVAATAPDGVVEPWHLPDEVSGIDSSATAAGSSPPPAPFGFRPIDEEVQELERSRMVAALAAAGGVQKHAASLLTMPLRTFMTRMRQYGLSAK